MAVKDQTIERCICISEVYIDGTERCEHEVLLRAAEAKKPKEFEYVVISRLGNGATKKKLGRMESLCIHLTLRLWIRNRTTIKKAEGD